LNLNIDSTKQPVVNNAKDSINKKDPISSEISDKLDCTNVQSDDSTSTVHSNTSIIKETQPRRPSNSSKKQVNPKRTPRKKETSNPRIVEASFS